jgi:hypothetical protein
MNALQPITAQPAGLALVPTNINDAMRLAEMMAKGKLVPQALQSSPADCLLVIEQATRWGMSPFAVAQEVSVIQGKLMHSGKIVAAAIQSSGVLAGRLHYDYSSAGDDRTVIVSGTLAGEAKPRDVAVRLGDVRTNNKVWTTQPDQQLAYHGARVWARRYAPEVMLCVWSPEEMPEAPQEEPRAVPNLAPAPLPDAEFPWIAMDGTELQVSGKTWIKQLGKALSHLREADAIRLWHSARRGSFNDINDSGSEGSVLIDTAERAIAIRIAEIEEQTA